MKRMIFFLIALFLFNVKGDFFVLAQEPVAAAAKSEILKYREQQDIFSDDLQGLGYSEAVKVIKDDVSPAKNAASCYKRGKDYFKNSEYEKALVEFKKALEWDPQYKPALKYIDLVQEKIIQSQQRNEQKKSVGEDKQDKDYNAQLVRSQMTKARHEQLINLLRQEVDRVQKAAEIKEKSLDPDKQDNAQGQAGSTVNKPALSRIEQGFEDKYIKLFKEKETIENNYTKLLEQVKELIQDSARVEELESALGRSSIEMDLVKKESEKIKKEYNGLLSQVQLVFTYKQRVKELEMLLEKNVADKNLFEKEKEVAKLENAELKIRVKEFEDSLPKIIKDRDGYKEAYERLYTDAVAKELKVKEFKDEAQAQTKKNKDMDSELKQLRAENKKIKQEYGAILTQSKDSFPDKRRIKESESLLAKNAAEIKLLAKEKDALKAERNRVVTQMKSYLSDRRRLKETEDSFAESKSELKAAKKENEVIRKDYDSLLSQVKSSIIDKGKLNEFEGAIEKYKNDLQLMAKDNENLKTENLKLKNKVSQLENAQAEAASARDEYKSLYEKTRSDTAAKELKGRLEGLEKEKDSLLSQLKQAQTENETVKKDYNSLLAQVNDLLVDKKHRGTLEKDNEVIKAENSELKDKVNKLEELERKRAKDNVDARESDSKRLKIKQIKQDNIDKKGNEINLNQMAANEALVKELQSKFDAEKKQLSKQAEEYKKKYLSELEKNNLAVQGANNLPKKLSDVVKRNEELLKETSGMHYNLGVFFIKNKEYDRAIIEFEKAIELYPEDPYSYYNLGYIYAQYLVDRAKAVKYFQQFLQFVKNDDKDVEWVKDYLLTWESYK